MDPIGSGKIMRPSLCGSPGDRSVGSRLCKNTSIGSSQRCWKKLQILININGPVWGIDILQPENHSLGTVATIGYRSATVLTTAGKGSC
jgi:hypothetical protein